VRLSLYNTLPIQGLEAAELEAHQGGQPDRPEQDFDCATEELTKGSAWLQGVQQHRGPGEEHGGVVTAGVESALGVHEEASLETIIGVDAAEVRPDWLELLFRERVESAITFVRDVGERADGRGLEGGENREETEGNRGGVEQVLVWVRRLQRDEGFRAAVHDDGAAGPAFDGADGDEEPGQLSGVFYIYYDFFY
jgi:hypothetical protein